MHTFPCRHIEPPASNTCAGGAVDQCLTCCCPAQTRTYRLWTGQLCYTQPQEVTSRAPIPCPSAKTSTLTPQQHLRRRQRQRRQRQRRQQQQQRYHQPSLLQRCPENLLRQRWIQTPCHRRFLCTSRSTTSLSPVWPRFRANGARCTQAIYFAGTATQTYTQPPALYIHTCVQRRSMPAVLPTDRLALTCTPHHLSLRNFAADVPAYMMHACINHCLHACNISEMRGVVRACERCE